MTTRRIGHASIFDQILEISDRPVIGTKTITKGNGEVQIIEGDIEHRRLQIDARKWMLAKALPKICGDKVQVDNTHRALDGDSKPMSVLETARRLVRMGSQRRHDIGREVPPASPSSCIWAMCWASSLSSA